MGIYYAEEHFMDDYGTAFGCEAVEQLHGPYADAAAAWNKVVELALRDIKYCPVGGTMTVYPGRAICFQEDPEQGHSDWEHSVLQKEEL